MSFCVCGTTMLVHLTLGCTSFNSIPAYLFDMYESAWHCAGTAGFLFQREGGAFVSPWDLLAALVSIDPCIYLELPPPTPPPPPPKKKKYKNTPLSILFWMKPSCVCSSGHIVIWTFQICLKWRRRWGPLSKMDCCGAPVSSMFIGWVLEYSTVVLSFVSQMSYQWV